MGLGPQKRSLAAGACAVEPVFFEFFFFSASAWFFLPLCSLSSVVMQTVAVRPPFVQLSPACSNPPRRGLASVGVGVLGAPDPAPEAVTNYYVTRPPPLEDSPSQNPAMQPLKMIAMEF